LWARYPCSERDLFIHPEWRPRSRSAGFRGATPMGFAMYAPPPRLCLGRGTERDQFTLHMEAPVFVIPGSLFPHLPPSPSAQNPAPVSCPWAGVDNSTHGRRSALGVQGSLKQQRACFSGTTVATPSLAAHAAPWQRQHYCCTAFSWLQRRTGSSTIRTTPGSSHRTRDPALS